ncbi:hypothetical protein CBR_g54216 [Chara braunii]|uniref:DUF659 domain-containing protein n=1 Tax=Chara braunii TaxID=69332 RepID=A0A388K7J6_CHABU|nr:hypothetical protein CBR_g54216 [Chara braunii]|eukprot:GBG65923.1 hypothetical protein CBR_g54216 [Chara braunii]
MSRRGGRSGGGGGSGGADFIPVSDAEMAKLRRSSCVWKYVTLGQPVGSWEKMHGDRKLRCNLCKHLWQGNQSKAARHFCQLKKCRVAQFDVLVDIRNGTDYRFDDRHLASIRTYMEEHGIRDSRAVAGGCTGADPCTAGRDDVQDVLDEMEEREGVELPGEEVVMTSRGEDPEIRKGKRPMGETDQAAIRPGKRVRQSKIDEVYTADKQSVFNNKFLQWIYDAGIPFNSFRRQSWREIRKAADQLPREVRMRFPAFKEIAGATGALLYPTICHDGSVQETDAIVFRRWKAKDVIALCTDSASNYTAAARLLAVGPDPVVRRITWLPCSTHVCNLMLSDIGTRVGWAVDTIIRGRAMVRFIKSHSAALALYKKKNPRVSLVQPVETRFASVFMMLTCLLGRRDSLEAMLHDDAWASIPLQRRVLPQARWVCLQIRDGEFWRYVEFLILVMEPIHQLLRRMDKGGMMMSIVYEWSRHLVQLLTKLDVVPTDLLSPTTEQVYFTYGGGSVGHAPRTSVITDDVAGGAQGSATRHPPAGRGRGAVARDVHPRVRRVLGVASSDEDEGVAPHADRLRDRRFDPSHHSREHSEQLRRSHRLAERSIPASQQPQDISVTEGTPSHSGPAQAATSSLRTSDFDIAGSHGGSPVLRYRVHDRPDYSTDVRETEETVKERDARLDREEEVRLQSMAQWEGREAYEAEQRRQRELETIGAGPPSSVGRMPTSDTMQPPSGPSHVVGGGADTCGFPAGCGGQADVPCEGGPVGGVETVQSDTGAESSDDGEECAAAEGIVGDVVIGICAAGTDGGTHGGEEGMVDEGSVPLPQEELVDEGSVPLPQEELVDEGRGVGGRGECSFASGGVGGRGECSFASRGVGGRAECSFFALGGVGRGRLALPEKEFVDEGNVPDEELVDEGVAVDAGHSAPSVRDGVIRGHVEEEGAAIDMSLTIIVRPPSVRDVKRGGHIDAGGPGCFSTGGHFGEMPRWDGGEPGECTPTPLHPEQLERLGTEEPFPFTGGHPSPPPWAPVSPMWTGSSQSDIRERESLERQAAVFSSGHGSSHAQPLTRPQGRYAVEVVPGRKPSGERKPFGERKPSGETIVAGRRDDVPVVDHTDKFWMLDWVGDIGQPSSGLVLYVVIKENIVQAGGLVRWTGQNAPFATFELTMVLNGRGERIPSVKHVALRWAKDAGFGKSLVDVFNPPGTAEVKLPDVVDVLGFFESNVIVGEEPVVHPEDRISEPKCVLSKTVETGPSITIRNTPPGPKAGQIGEKGPCRGLVVPSAPMKTRPTATKAPVALGSRPRYVVATLGPLPLVGQQRYDYTVPSRAVEAHEYFEDEDEENIEEYSKRARGQEQYAAGVGGMTRHPGETSKVIGQGEDSEHTVSELGGEVGLAGGYGSSYEGCEGAVAGHTDAAGLAERKRKHRHERRNLMDSKRSRQEAVGKRQLKILPVDEAVQRTRETEAVMKKKQQPKKRKAKGGVMEKTFVFSAEQPQSAEEAKGKTVTRPPSLRNVSSVTSSSVLSKGFFLELDERGNQCPDMEFIFVQFDRILDIPDGEFRYNQRYLVQQTIDDIHDAMVTSGEAAIRERTTGAAGVNVCILYEKPVLLLVALRDTLHTDASGRSVRARRVLPDEFDLESVNKYYYYPLSGQHNMMAARRCFVERPDIAQELRLDRWIARPVYYPEKSMDNYGTLSTFQNAKDKWNTPPHQIVVI